MCECVYIFYLNNIKEYEINKCFLFLNLIEVSNLFIGINKCVGYFFLVNYEKFDEFVCLYGCEWCG